MLYVAVSERLHVSSTRSYVTTDIKKIVLQWLFRVVCGSHTIIMNLLFECEITTV